MLAKRIIFTLIYDQGFFMQSRNFRLQRAGDSDWINNNYNFSDISRYIDEIIFLDCSREDFPFEKKYDDFLKVTRNCFVPKAMGGRIRSINDVDFAFSNGADKVVLNTALFKNEKLIKEVSEKYGTQSIIGSIDYKVLNNQPIIFTCNGKCNSEINLLDFINSEILKFVGELFITSIDKDGTGQGFDVNFLSKAARLTAVPLIASGGAGNYNHFIEVNKFENISAYSTANLFNFIGNGLENTRNKLISNGINFPIWDYSSV